ncbi:fasciclin-like arabinogalactan protein 13 [Typha latifolia]|uniref:fasciclin-like arabinogalactan protein 13 n=1 Tax=Typha latifolia TaxID=4733 RepID=UPI003C2DD4D2
MASTTLISAFLLYTMLATTFAQPAAPAPSPAAPINVTAILAKAGNYNSFIRLLNHTRVNEVIDRQVNDSNNAITLFAPTDNAFLNLPSGTINNLTQQQQIELTLYHLLPQFYTFATFATASNPLNTEAAGEGGQYTLNVTGTGNQVNISTGVVVTPISYSIRAERPLAVYSVEKVLLPYAIFGTKTPPSAPAAAPPGQNHKSPPAAEAPSMPSSPPPEGSLTARLEVWSWVVSMGVMGVIGSLL